MTHMKVNVAIVTTPPQYSESSSWNHSGSVTSPKLDEYCASEPCLVCGSTLENIAGDCAVCDGQATADMVEEHGCPQCDSLDPSEQCDSCEGCENCLEFCPHCENPTCTDCCDEHS